MFLGWDECDQDLALAAEQRRRETCQHCGVHKDDHDRVCAVPERCPTCEDSEQTRDEIPDSEKGVHVKVVPVEYAQQLAAQSKFDPFTGGEQWRSETSASPSPETPITSKPR